MARASTVTSDKDDITGTVIDCFKQLLMDGVLFPGCKLPPEREFARKLGISRAALRQASKALATMGILSQRVGDGTYLKPDAANILNRPMEFLVLLDAVTADELMEARLVVEPELSARAAERATLEDLAAMRQALRPIRPFSRARMMEQDLAFDQAIFRAARNRIFERMFPLIHQSMLTSVQLTYQMVDWDYTVSFHTPIYSAIEKRQPEEARQAMLAHLSDVHRLLKEAVSIPARVVLPASLPQLSTRPR